ncbi:MAG: hypothetical protein ACI4EI_04255 [Muricoprocola sp.]
MEERRYHRIQNKRHYKRSHRKSGRHVTGIISIVLILTFMVSIFVCNTTDAATGRQYKYYTEVYVGRHDTLESIAYKYISEEYASVKEYINEVREINDLGLEVQYGQHIMVPYYSSDRK